jgi:single-stranded-DNA-specific exonuclease
MEYAERVLTANDLYRVIAHDGALSVSDVDLSLCRALEVAAPFGRKNPEPSFVFSNLTPTSIREIGNGHLKASVDPQRGIELIAFGAADRLAAFRPGMTVVATPEVNTWRGTHSVQLRVKDVAS